MRAAVGIAALLLVAACGGPSPARHGPADDVERSPEATAVDRSPPALPAPLPRATIAVVGAADACDHPTVVGTDRAEMLVGTSGPDVIDGGGGHDVIKGGDGDDILCGGDAEDRLIGGPGDDRLFGGNDGVQHERSGTPHPSPDWLDGGPGDDFLDGGVDPAWHDGWTDLTFQSSSGPVRVDLRSLTATGDGTDRLAGGQQWHVFGSPHDDLLVGTDHNDDLSGGAGDDTIFGLGGNDSLDGETAGTTDPGYNAVNQGPDADVLVGGTGDDQLTALAGPDRLFGDEGKDSLHDEAWSSDDRPDNGADQLYGGPGDDYLTDAPSAMSGELIDGGGGTDMRSAADRKGLTIVSIEQDCWDEDPAIC